MLCHWMSSTHRLSPCSAGCRAGMRLPLAHAPDSPTPPLLLLLLLLQDVYKRTVNTTLWNGNTTAPADIMSPTYAKAGQLGPAAAWPGCKPRVCRPALLLRPDLAAVRALVPQEVVPQVHAHDCGP